MALPPFRRVPYDASQATARMSDLVLRGGDIRAQGELQRGALWGGMVNQLGQIAGKTLGDLAAYREEAPRREAQQLALNKLRREESTEKNLAGIRQMAADGNLSSLDTAKLYEQAGYPEQAQRVRQGFLANVKTMGEINAMKLDMAGHAAKRIQLAGNTPDAFRAEIQGLLKSGTFTAEEVQPYLDALEQAQSQLPAKALPGGPKVETGIERLTTQILQQAPAYQPDLTPYTLSPGEMRMKGTQVVATNPKAPEPTKALTPQERFNDAVAANDEAGKAAALRDMALVSGAQRDPRGGGEKPLTRVQENAIIGSQKAALRKAEDEYQDAISPRRAKQEDVDFNLAKNVGDLVYPNAEEVRIARRRLDARKRDIMEEYHAKMGEVAPVWVPDAWDTSARRTATGDLALPPPQGGSMADLTSPPSTPPPPAPGAAPATPAPTGNIDWAKLGSLREALAKGQAVYVTTKQGRVRIRAINPDGTFEPW